MALRRRSSRGRWLRTDRGIDLHDIILVDYEPARLEVCDAKPARFRRRKASLREHACVLCVDFNGHFVGLQDRNDVIYVDPGTDRLRQLNYRRL